MVKFATQKEKRLHGLAAHAVFPISTGKLEGFNNKIKVAKRIACGYRDEDYFFTLIRYLSLLLIVFVVLFLFFGYLLTEYLVSRRFAKDELIPTLKDDMYE